MNESSVHPLLATAEAYERRLVPGIFEAWTECLLDAAEVGPGQKVLDVACGTGVLARAAAARVAADGSVAGLDVNPAMLEVARRVAPDIDWREGRAEALPFDDADFDAVVSQFGLMFFDDRVTALREMNRVLAPGGRLAVAVFDSLDNNTMYADMVAVLERSVGDAAAQALRLPFTLGDAGELLALFDDAGIVSAAVSTLQRAERFPSVKDMVLADVQGWFPLAGIGLDEPVLGTLIDAAQSALGHYLTPAGAVDFPASAHIVTARKA